MNYIVSKKMSLTRYTGQEVRGKDIKMLKRNESLLLGIDVGTTNTKATLIDTKCRIMGSASKGYPIHHPRPNWAQQEPSDWWKAVVETVKEIVASTNISPSAILGIGVSGQSSAVTPITHKGDVLRPSPLWMDRRSEEQTAWLKEVVGSEIFTIHGTEVDSWDAIPKILWMKKNEPSLYKQTYKFLSTTSYINFKLTGKFTMNLSDGGILCLYDRTAKDWSKDIAEIMGLDIEKLPPLYKCTEVIGKLSKEAAKSLGIPSGIPVIGGAVDTSAGVFALGITGPGQAYYVMGTGSNVGVCIDRPLSVKNLITFPHVVLDLELVNATMATTGVCLDWFCRQFGHMEKKVSMLLDDSLDPFTLLSMQAEKANPGSGGLIFLPYMAGEIHPIANREARGVFFGLSLATKKADVIRAIMEGCAYALYHNIRVIEEYKVKITELRVMGGPTRSRVWNQINADVINKPIILVESNRDASFGDALLAGVGVGIYSSFLEAAKTAKTKEARFDSDDLTHKKYDQLFCIYRSLYVHLEKDFHLLSTFLTKQRRLEDMAQ